MRVCVSLLSGPALVPPSGHEHGTSMSATFEIDSFREVHQRFLPTLLRPVSFTAQIMLASIQRKKKHTQHEAFHPLLKKPPAFP